MSRPICFMVMPFGTKETGLSAGEGPVSVDFDALWEKALAPVIDELGYVPVRADQETGALIIDQMLQRLAGADLVIADISIANANVYYEVGVRHAARSRHCVLLSADWARPVFDLASIRRLTYPMPEGSINAATAEQIHRTLLDAIPAMANGTTPVFESVPGFPDVDRSADWVEAFRREAQSLVDWSERTAAIRAIQDNSKKSAAALALRDELLTQAALSDSMWLAMLSFLRDATSNWQVVLDWLARMPEHLASRPDCIEQRLLAEAKLKGADLEQQAGALEHLIEQFGPSSERYGLLGGRYKALFDDCRKQLPSADGENRRKLQRNMALYLDRAIDAYRKGMLCDLNDYYPSCNLPGLLAIRGEEGDAELARAAANVTTIACERAKGLGSEDKWLNPTLLVAAFQAGDIALAKKLLKKIRLQGAAAWKLETAMKDLQRTLEHMSDSTAREELGEIHEALGDLL